MRGIIFAVALAAISSTAMAAGHYPKGDGPAGRVNAAHAAGFPTIEACQQALAAEITLQANDMTKRPKWAKNAPVERFTARQTQMTECRADDSGKFRVYLKTATNN